MVVDDLTKEKIISAYRNFEGLIREGDSPSLDQKFEEESEFDLNKELRSGLEGRLANYIKKVGEAFIYFISFSPATPSFKDSLVRGFYTIYKLNLFSTSHLLKIINGYLPISSKGEFLFHLFDLDRIEEIEKRRYKKIKTLVDLGKLGEKEKQNFIRWRIEIEERYGSIE